MVWYLLKIIGVVTGLQKLVWYVLEFIGVIKGSRVKKLREKKATHQQALKLVEYLCTQIMSRLPEKEASDIFRISIIKAAKYGISEIVEMIIQKFPMATFDTDGDGMNVLLLATRYRYENVVKLFYNMSDRKYIFFDSTDEEDNNILHICGKLAPPHRLNLVAGAALQMQSELRWFKEMEYFVNPSRRTWKNNEIETPQMVFTREHKTLKADGERWMKDTAKACTIAAALIATVVFAAAFTVPGGIESGSGSGAGAGAPVFEGRNAFKLFAISDAISMFTSITSLLMFLSILTARYAEEDFLHDLPQRLGFGLLSLFVSITSMLVAYSAAIYLLLQRDDHMTWFVVIIGGLVCLPVITFLLLQLPLFLDIAASSFGSGSFSKIKGSGTKGNSLLY